MHPLSDERFQAVLDEFLVAPVLETPAACRVSPILRSV